GLNLVVKDLGSTNGVFLNRERIPMNEERLMKPGDQLRFGGQDYVFCDNEEDVKKIDVPPNRRKYPRPENLYDLENFLTFFHAPYLFRGLYVFTILGALGSFFYHLELTEEVPKHLSFLSSFYSEKI